MPYINNLNNPLFFRKKQIPTPQKSNSTKISTSVFFRWKWKKWIRPTFQPHEPVRFHQKILGRKYLKHSSHLSRRSHLKASSHLNQLNHLSSDLNPPFKHRRKLQHLESLHQHRLGGWWVGLEVTKKVLGFLGRNIILNDRIYSHKSCTVIHLQYLSPIFCDSMFCCGGFWKVFLVVVFLSNHAIFGFNSGWFNPSRSRGNLSQTKRRPATGRFFFGLELQEVQGFLWHHLVGCHPWINLGSMVFFSPKKGGNYIKNLSATCLLASWNDDGLLCFEHEILQT